MTSVGPLLGAHNLVRGGQVHILGRRDRQARLRKRVRVVVLGQKGLQLVHGNLEKAMKHVNIKVRIRIRNGAESGGRPDLRYQCDNDDWKQVFSRAASVRPSVIRSNGVPSTQMSEVQSTPHVRSR